MCKNVRGFGMESENGEKGLENLLGIAVFSPDGSRFSVMNFLHIFVRDKEKENLYAKELFDYAIDQFRHRGNWQCTETCMIYHVNSDFSHKV